MKVVVPVNVTTPFAVDCDNVAFCDVPFNVTATFIAFLLFTLATVPLTVATTVVPSDCLDSENSVMLGTEYAYTVNATEG